MKDSIFEYRSYKKYLNELAETKQGQGRGFRSLLAEAAGCQTAYVSQVLNGNANFSLEQADLINQFVGHTKDEAEFFFLLIQHERAGTESLRKHFSKSLKDAYEKNLGLKKKVIVQKDLTSEQQTIYYSAWYYVATHLITMIPGFQDKEAISKQLGLSLKKVSEILDFLTSVGLVIQEKGKYKIGTTQLHLAGDSPMLNQHHINWRLQAIRSLNREHTKDLHYSAAITISNEDITRIRAILAKTIEEINQVVKDSKEQGIHSLVIDFFQL